MKTNILDLVAFKNAHKKVNTLLSILPFVHFLEGKITDGSGVRTQQLQYILDQIREYPGWDQEITTEKIEAYRELFELIRVTLAAPLTDENEDMWALAVPFTPTLFFGTNALYEFLEHKKGTIKQHMIDDTGVQEQEQSRLTLIYGMIMEKFYGFATHMQSNMIHHIRDEATGLNKYYRLSFDTRFVEIDYDGVLPEISFENIRLGDDGKQNALDTLQQFLPLERFRFRGFSIISIQDITAQHVIEHIKDIIVNLAPGQMVYNDITSALKEILGNESLDVSLMPVIKVNGKLVMNHFEGINESMAGICSRYNMPMQSYLDTLQRYTTDPQVVLRKNVSEVIEGEEEIFVLLREMGVEGLIVLPILFQKQLVGVLTIYSRQKEVLDENTLTLLEPAIPLLEQLLQTTADDFQIVLDNTVKDKFTSLQPSVEWRFNEVAFEYLQNRKQDPRAEIEQVYFPDVYPLYGAVDIRNSTLERGNALRMDMQSQLRFLIDVLDQLRHHRELGLTNELIYKCNRWLQAISEFISSDDEFQLNIFFEEEVTPFLLHFQQSYPDTREPINKYFLAIGPTGVAHNNRRALETSLQMLNRTISNLLDQMNVEVQHTYPCYFEKFRSDGIEYDIYIGQSITPGREFHPLYLKNLRLWQLNSMAIIAKLTHALQSELPRKLETTQLIFVHANTIDISFRSDEHRFDVEGSYNIRYEMIKKRIDKVLIKNTSQRLTQPGMIALVYFQQKDVEEYLSHIHYLQDQQILAGEIEFLELEELQGVNGLKALRVSVLIEEEETLLPGEEAQDRQVLAHSHGKR